MLADPAVEIVFHAGRQDVAILRRVWRTDVTNIFDTQIAAGFAGMRAQLGYEALLSELLGVRLRKSASFTRWDARPLSDEQAAYAREDVLHLIEAADELKRRLDEHGRLQWAHEECARSSRSPTSARSRPSSAACRGSTRSSRARAPSRCALAQWREDCAMQEDKPVQTILADAALVEIAKRRPKDLERLRQIRGLHEGTVRRRGKAILDEVARGRELPPIPVEGDRPPPSDARDAALIVLAEALVRARAAESGFAYELLAARADLQRIVTAVRDWGSTSPTCARCRAGAASSSAPSCSSCSPGAARCGSARASRSRSTSAERSAASASSTTRAPARIAARAFAASVSRRPTSGVPGAGASCRTRPASGPSPRPRAASSSASAS